MGKRLYRITLIAYCIPHDILRREAIDWTPMIYFAPLALACTTSHSFLCRGYTAFIYLSIPVCFVAWKKIYLILRYKQCSVCTLLNLVIHLPIQTVDKLTLWERVFSPHYNIYARLIFCMVVPDIYMWRVGLVEKMQFHFFLKSWMCVGTSI